MVRIVLYIYFIFLSTKVLGEELNHQEKFYFNFIDLNNDKKISINEVNQSIQIIFQLIDENRDGYLSQLEIIELKNIIESLS